MTTLILRYSSLQSYTLWLILDLVLPQLQRVQHIWGGRERDENQEISQESGDARESHFTKGFSQSEASMADLALMASIMRVWWSNAVA